MTVTRTTETPRHRGSVFCLVLCASASLWFAWTGIGCSRQAAPPAAPRATNLVLVTIDTLRADHVGAYGAARARTPVLDRLARAGVRFEHAYAPAPITLSSHASMLTGRYPAGHGARHNGLRMRDDVRTLATTLQAAGFATAAFVSAFPLDRRFGLARGFDVYDDRMPRGADGRVANERPGGDTVAAALTWLRTARAGRQPPTAGRRSFLWIHLFEPHAPYEGDSSIPPPERYDQEIARADVLLGRIVEAVGEAGDTLVVVAGDHGEAFGEHDEIGHSIFVYDTTLRVPLVMRGPGIPERRVVADPVSLVDIAPTVLKALGVEAPFDADGVDLAPAIAGEPLGGRALMAESFAPLVDFGWAPLRAVREGGWKYIAAPRPELFDLGTDAREQRNRVGDDPSRAATLAARLERYSPATLPARETMGSGVSGETAARLRALGYASGSAAPAAGPKPDPKDRIAIASALAQVTSGEARGAEAERLLDAALGTDATNPLAHVRLGVLQAGRQRCDLAAPHFARAIALAFPSADPALGLAACRQARGDRAGALDALLAGRRLEPGNPVVEADIGILHMEAGHLADAITALSEAVRLDPDFHEARFNLVRALARAGRRGEARMMVTDLLGRLPANAPQRPEVERLRDTLR